jgi:phage terminase small subunit
MNTGKLTPRQARFVENYLLDLNASAAAARAGYSQKTARSIGQRLLTNVDIGAAITEAKRERSEATGIDAAWVLKKAVEVYQRVTQEIRPVRNPRTGKQVYDDDGNALFTFNAAAANRALEIIGKHVEVAAFKDRLEISGEMSLTDRIKAAKEQAYQPALDRLKEAPASE